MNEKFYSAKEAASILHISLRTLKSKLKAHNISAVQTGAHGTKFYSGVQIENLRCAISKNVNVQSDSGVQIKSTDSKSVTSGVQSVDINNQNLAKSEFQTWQNREIENQNREIKFQTAKSNSKTLTSGVQSADINNQKPAQPFQSNTTLKKYKTKKSIEAHASDSDTKALIVSNYPNDIAVPTFQPYQFATSLFQNGNAYLQAGVNTKNLKFQDGKLFFEDSTGIMRRVSEVELITDFATKEPITQIDGLSFLRAYYSILLAHYISALKNHEPLPKIIKLYMPDFAEFLDYDRNISKETVNSIVRKMISFHKVIGVMRNKIGDKVYTSYYPIFHFEGYNAESNTIEIYSPYLNRVIENILKEAIKLNPKTHKPILDKIGKTIPLASHSYLIKPSIARERNFIAIENVVVIIQLIEQAGDNTPHIKASTLIERNPQLQYRLNETPSKHKSRVLQRIFKSTWELLREQTHLIEVYKNIKLPDPDDPANIPTVKSLKKMVFVFPHEGKIKK